MGAIRDRRPRGSTEPASALPAAPIGPFEGVLFDVDGTLADSVALFYEMSLEVFEEAQLPPPTRDRVYELMSLGESNPWPKLFPADHPDIDALVGRVIGERREAWMRRYYFETEPHPGVEIVDHLAEAGVKLGIVTSSERDLPFIRRWGIRHHFGAVIGREDVTRRKPHPEPIVRCLKLLALAPAAAVYVGDSLIDIHAAHAAGVRAVGVTTGTTRREPMEEAGADWVVDSLHELKAWLRHPIPGGRNDESGGSDE